MDILIELKSENDYLEFCESRREYLKRRSHELINKSELNEDEYFTNLYLPHEFDDINSKIYLCKLRIDELNKKLNLFN